MAKKNWYIEANKSQDPEIKGLLVRYNTLDADSDGYQEIKESLISEIKVKLGLEEKPIEKVKIESDVESIDKELDAQDEPDIPEEEPTVSSVEPSERRARTFEPIEVVNEFSYTEEDIAKTNDLDELRKIRNECRDEIKRLENTRLKHATYKQNRILDMQIWNVRRIVSLSLRREVAIKQRQKQLEKAGKVSSVALKRARFIKLFRQGFSITNITLHTEGVKKNELKTVLDEETVKACTKINSRFPQMWERWQAKFIDNDNKK
jgi:hypothetical protein